MLYLPSFRRSAHQDDIPPPLYSYRPYTPEPIPAPAPLNYHTPNLNTNTYTNTNVPNATPHNNGTTFISPYSTPHLSSAASEPAQPALAHLTQNAHYTLLTLSALALATAITTIGLAADTLHSYHDAQSSPHHLRLLPPNLNAAPTVAVLGTAALVAVLNATFFIVSVLQTTPPQHPNQTPNTPLLALLTSLSTLPFTLFALIYYHLHAFALPASAQSLPSSSASSGPALSARGVAPAPVPTPTSSAGARSTATVVAGLQGWACRFGTGEMGVGGRVCGEGRGLGGLVAVLVAAGVLGVVGGGVGVWVGRRRGTGSGGERESDSGSGQVGKGRVEGGWL